MEVKIDKSLGNLIIMYMRKTNGTLSDVQEIFGISNQDIERKIKPRQMEVINELNSINEIKSNGNFEIKKPSSLLSTLLSASQYEGVPLRDGIADNYGEEEVEHIVDSIYGKGR